jgi:hypothetical protein
MGVQIGGIMSYKKGDYDKYHDSPRMKKERALRNKNRRKALKDGKVRKGDSLEIDHADGNPRNNAARNLKVISRHKNRVKQ